MLLVVYLTHIRLILLCGVREIDDYLECFIGTALQLQHHMIQQLVGDMQLLAVKLPSHQDEDRITSSGMTSLTETQLISKLCLTKLYPPDRRPP